MSAKRMRADNLHRIKEKYVYYHVESTFHPRENKLKYYYIISKHNTNW